MISYSRERQYKRIEDRKQFFFDDDMIACVRNIARTQHEPVKHPANPLIERDRPWEVVPYFRTPTFSVHYDPIARKYVLYGRADHPWNSTHPAFQGWFATVWPDQPTGIWNTRRCVYRLESDDCLRWAPAA